MVITKYYSPNFDKKRRSNKSITAIIIHYTGMQSERESLQRLVSPRSKVSCHYLINRKGLIFKLVKDENVAWHAGKSMWQKFRNLNKNSIGIELVNRGHRFGYQVFPKAQITTLIHLCKILKKKYKIKNKFILGHSDVSPLRKIDPGEKFPWQYLSSKGIGVFPNKIKKFKENKKRENLTLFFKNLHQIGYRYLKRKFRRKIISNFQRRFRQRKVNGILDSETLRISDILAKKPNIS
tara:strand:- start:112 stop:822 length:711 start_codon:yes stop_codon:yes gene_type:complete